MSHVKNVEAFGKLIGICTGLGENYTPGQPKLSIASLNTLLLNARQALDQVQEATKNLANVSNAREVEFEKVRKLAARVVSEFRFSGVLEQNLNDVRAAYRKLAGYRISRDPVLSEVAKSEKKLRRPRGSDYITQAETFSMFIKLVSAEPNYNPVREELTVAALHGVAEGLQTHNTRVLEAYNTLAAARRHRNDILYRVSGNVVELMRSVKHNFRATFGFQGEAYKVVSKIFVTPPNNV